MAAVIANPCNSPCVGGVGHVVAVPADDFYLLLDRSQIDESDPASNVDALMWRTRNERFDLATLKNRDRARPILNKLPTPGLHFDPKDGASYYVYGVGLDTDLQGYCDGLEWAELRLWRPRPEDAMSALDHLFWRVDVCPSRPDLYRHVQIIANRAFYAKEGVPELVDCRILHVRYSTTFPSRLEPDVADDEGILTIPSDALPGSEYPVNELLFETYAPVVWNFEPNGSYGRHTKFYTSKKFETVASLVGFVVAPYCWASAEIRLPRRRHESPQVATVVYGVECANPTCNDSDCIYRDVDRLLDHVRACFGVNLRPQVLALNCPQAN